MMLFIKASVSAENFMFSVSLILFTGLRPGLFSQGYTLAFLNPQGCTLGYVMSALQA